MTTGVSIFGHRGGDPGPENSVAAIEQAARDGADGVEIDIQIDGDGQPVARHDLPERDAATGRTPPVRLAEILATVDGADLDLLIDFKSGGEPEREAAILARALAPVARPETVRVSSFSLPFLEALSALDTPHRLYPIVSLRQNLLTGFDHDRWAGASVLATALPVSPFLLTGLRRSDGELLVWFAVTEWNPLIRMVVRLGAAGVIVKKVAATVGLFGP